MKKIIIFVAAFGLTALVGGIIGYRAGRNDAVIEDFKVYNAGLVDYYGFPEDRKIELQDFLKARYYYFANRVPANVLGEPYDFGSVDFKGMAVSRELTTPKHEYELFKSKPVTFKKPYVADGNMERANSNNVPPVK